MKKIFILLVVILVAVVYFGEKTDRENSSTPDPDLETSPLYKSEQAVTINGYKEDAMEPFISRDGEFLFFNSLNNGKTTSLYYAKRETDTNFEFVGEVKGVNEPKPHLDAVASLDTEGNFYWVSLRNYPTVIENLQTGTFENGEVTNVRQVLGDFYIRENGWIIMDAEISPDGQHLYYVNADFSNGGSVPQKTILGVAHKESDTFVADLKNEEIFAALNKLTLVYAPSISADGLTLIFTRLVPGKETQMYIAKRNDINLPFNQPELIDVTGDLPEGSSLSLDTNHLYYHKKVGGTYKIFKASR